MNIGIAEVIIRYLGHIVIKYNYTNISQYNKYACLDLSESSIGLLLLYLPVITAIKEQSMDDKYILL